MADGRWQGAGSREQGSSTKDSSSRTGASHHACSRQTSRPADQQTINFMSSIIHHLIPHGWTLCNSDQTAFHVSVLTLPHSCHVAPPTVVCQSVKPAMSKMQSFPSMHLHGGFLGLVLTTDPKTLVAFLFISHVANEQPPTSIAHPSIHPSIYRLFLLYPLLAVSIK